MNNKAVVTAFKIETDAYGIEATIVVRRVPADVTFSNRPNAIDVPPDLREALLLWLHGRRPTN